jgi:hypothetical protein
MKIEQILKWYLRVTSIYLILDGLSHVLDFKLTDAGTWPAYALLYSQQMNHLFGAFAILSGLFGVEASRDLRKYRNFLHLTAIWILGYGAYLLYSGLVIDFRQIFKDYPSVYVWMPFYNFYLIFEAGLCFALSILIYLFKKQTKTHG